MRFGVSDSGYQIPGIGFRESSFRSTWRVEGGGWEMEGGAANRVAAEARALSQDIAELAPLQEVQHRRALHLGWGVPLGSLGPSRPNIGGHRNWYCRKAMLPFGSHQAGFGIWVGS